MVIATALLQGGVCKTATSPSTTSTTTPVPTPSTTPGLSNGLVLTLPMEWSSWNRFGDQIEGPLIKNTMDTRASNGLRDIGYVSINLDDGWQRYKSNRSHKSDRSRRNIVPIGHTRNLCSCVFISVFFYFLTNM